MSNSNFNTYSQYYDTLYKDKNYKEEADYVTDLIRGFDPSARKLLELGCGTGSHAQHLCNNNFSVTGIERSDRMVAIAKQKEIAHFTPITGNITSYKIEESFDVAISLFHVISYLTSTADVLSCLSTTNNHLNKGGIFVFDIWYSPAVYYQKPETENQAFTSREPGNSKNRRTRVAL